MRNTNYTKEFHTLTWTDTYMLLFNGLGEFTHNELFQVPKNSLVGDPYKRKECNSFYYVLILIGLLLKMENGRATNDFMTQQEVKCTPNNQMQMHCVK